jgi:hypothetical protein
MSLRAAPHDLADQPVYGTPRTLPFVLLCHATEQFCGRFWIANTWDQYDGMVKAREAHEVFCGTATQHNLKLPL